MDNLPVPQQGESYLYDDAGGGAGGGAPAVSMGVWFKAAWRRKWLMLALLVVITGGGVLFTYLQKPVYEATAQLRFSERSSGAFNAQGSEQVTGNFVDTQIALLMRDAALRDIALDPALALSKSPMFLGEPDLVHALKDHIKVAPLKGTAILNISVQGEDRKLITAIANKAADYQRASVEENRDASMRSAMAEYVKKMNDMSSEMNTISQRIWTRANSARITSLTFNEQQQDSHVIVAAFQQQSAMLLTQRAEFRKQLDQSTADLASAETQFEAECDSLLCDVGPEAKPPAGNEDSLKPAGLEKPGAEKPTTAQPAAPALTSGSPAATAPAKPAAAAASADPADKPATPPGAAPEKTPIITAAQFATLYQQLLKVEAEMEKATPSTSQKAPASPQLAALEKQRAAVMAQVEDLRRRFQVQFQRAQETFQGQATAESKLAGEAERISQIEEALDARKQSLTAENYKQDFEVKMLLAREATLEAQYETDRAKLNADLAHVAILPRIVEEGQKVQELEKSAAALRAFRRSRKIYQENYDAAQTAYDALVSPLNDMLNESEKYNRIEQAYLKMEEWVRDVKLALSQITVSVYEASEPSIPIRPKWPINIALSGMFGAAAGVGVAMLLEFGRKTVKTPHDARRSLGTPVLAVVPHFPPLDFGDHVFSLEVLKDSGVTEVFNEIRLHLHAVSGARQPRSVLITSAASQEGKTTVSTLLAHSLARSGEKVLLVDANLRLPYLHSVFQCASQPGLADILQNGDDVRSCVRTTGIPNLSIMTAGAAGEDGLALVQPERFAQFVRAACEYFDHVIFDSTSTIGVADSRIIASGVDAVIYVVQADRLNSAIVSRGIDNIRQSRANLLGVILNNARNIKGDLYYFQKRAITRIGERKMLTAGETADTRDEGNRKE